MALLDRPSKEDSQDSQTTMDGIRLVSSINESVAVFLHIKSHHLSSLYPVVSLLFQPDEKSPQVLTVAFHCAKTAV